MPKVELFELQNRAQMHFFEFAPLLLREIKFEQRDFRDSALKNVFLEFSERLESCMGLCYPELRKIKLNLNYFAKRPELMAYTLYHEMVHQYLFDLQLPWGHTQDFYFLMELFPSRYQVDKGVHIHMRQAIAGKRKKEKRDAETTFDDKLNELMRTRFGQRA